MFSLSDAIHSISTSQPQIVFPPNKPIWNPMRHILIITNHFLLFCSHLAGRISWELPPPSWPALIANTPRKSKSLETTEWSYIVAGLVTKCSNHIQETAVFSVLMDRLNVMENKIVSMVFYHLLWLTTSKFSQSDSLTPSFPLTFTNNLQSQSIKDLPNQLRPWYASPASEITY